MKSIRKKLTLATCSLLAHSVPQANAEEAEDWAMDSSLLHYSEEDRITVNKFIGFINTNVSETDKVKVDLVFDTMSGATPSGAIQEAASFATISTPSGAGGFSSSSGSTAIAEFEDTRLGVGLDWEHTKKRTHRINYGATISVEKDYTAFGLSTNYAQDNSSRITTYSAGASVSFDSVRRSTGGTPTPLGEYANSDILEDGNKVVVDTIFGITRVLNRRTLAQLNYSVGFSDGYLTDPYKLISRTDVTDEGELDETLSYYESRPSTRQRNVAYTSLVHKTRHDNVIHLSYRYYWDDWEIKSNTFDLRFKVMFENGHFIEPHFRIYNQTAAYFHMYSIPQDIYGPAALGNVPEFASADYRLDEFDSSTVGLNYGKIFPGHGRLRFRMEYIVTEYANSVFPENKAAVVQLSYQKLFE